MKNIFAYTETKYQSYAGFVSINRDEKTGDITITVRSPDNGGSQIAAVKLPHGALEDMGTKIMEYVDKQEQA